MLDRNLVAPLLGLLLLAWCGCAQTPSAPPSRGRPGPVEDRSALVFGRIRIIENQQKTAWGKVFDRPTPELYHIEAKRFIDRITLTGGLFTEAFEQDGSFCWQLAPGTYFISRIVPWQTKGYTKAEDPQKNIFPGIAFQIREAKSAVYLGTLEIAIDSRTDFMDNKWITSSPVVRVLDEFEQGQNILQDRYPDFSGRTEQQLMVWNRNRMIPLYKTSALLQALNYLPWPLLMFP